MSPELTQPQQLIDEAVEFLRHIHSSNHKPTAVIAVSGGIDSAVSLHLVTQALGSKNVIPVLLPYGNQPMHDAYELLEHLQIAKDQWLEVNIVDIVDRFSDVLALSDADTLRKGNLKARCRMITVYDIAKKENALVCGTENKSEHYLGYFTRFGDAASDVEPICQFYKTQVRQLAAFLELPESILTKAPSAGLWVGQTDEAEMGFTYEQADQILYQLIDRGQKAEEIVVEGIDQTIVDKVIRQVESMHFKLEVPYMLD